MGKIGNVVTLLKRRRLDQLLAEVCRVLHLPIPTPRFPASLMIEPTNACNLKCPTCPTGTGKLNRPKRMMKLEEFQSIIDQGKGRVDFLVLFCYGEPFMHKDILKMVAYAQAASIGTILSTNGHFFHSVEYCREVVRSGMKKLIICVDGLDQKTIEGLRGEVSFEQITNGLRYMVQAKREMKSSTPQIQLQFIMMKYNQHQKEQVRQFAIDAGVDEFCVKPVGVGMRGPDFERLARELLPDDLGESHYQRDAAGKITLRGEAPRHCWWLTTMPVIYADGSVVPCCYDVCSEHVMGNVFEQSLADIWLGEKYRRFRREVRESRETITTCRFCIEGRGLGRMEEKLAHQKA